MEQDRTSNLALESLFYMDLNDLINDFDLLEVKRKK